jgi:hypothetical protein
MIAKHAAKLNMYRAVESHCDSNTGVISATPAFQNAFTVFKTKIATIDTTGQQKNTPLKGITVDKENLKQTLCQRASDVANIVYAFAAATSNSALKEEVNFPISKLARMKDTELAQICRQIHDKAFANKVPLQLNYGLTPQMLTDLQAAIDAYAAATPKPRTAMSQRKTLNASLRQLFKEADEVLLDQMDRLVVTFRESNPDFVTTYENARIIIDPSTTTTQLKGTVTKAADNAPVAGATVTIVETGKTAKTTTTGKYTIKPLAPNKYTVKVTATGFQDFQATDVDVKLGAVSNFNIVLVSV